MNNSRLPGHARQSSIGIAALLSLIVTMAAGCFPDSKERQEGVDDSTARSQVQAHVRKVALLVYDPLNPATGKRLSQTYGWAGYGVLEPHSEEIAEAIRNATGGHVDFQIVEKHLLNEFPLLLDGFRYDFASYHACHNNPQACHKPDSAAYMPIMVEDAGKNLCSAIQSGTIDEVWVWGFDYAGFDEFAFKIPGDAVKFPPEPYNYWIYDGRKKDLPACGRTYFVMGWNALVPGGNALHSVGHRIESALVASAPGRGKWGPCDHSSEWTDFACTGTDGGGLAGCGNVHVPPNGQSGYDYANTAFVQSYCDDYANYPALTYQSTPVNVNTWSPGGDAQWNYMLWWMAHIPRKPGSHVTGSLEVSNDWWNYILCYDGLCPLTGPIKKANWEPCANDADCQSNWCGCNGAPPPTVCLPNTNYPKSCQGGVDPCSNANGGNGPYCGGSLGAGDPNTLYNCQNGVTVSQQGCPNGCQMNPPAAPDACMAGGDPCANANGGNGPYCGGSLGAGDPNTLYNCQNGVTISQQVCPSACQMNPPGTADACLSSGGTCVGKCGMQSSGCWCDAACTGYGDCCPDKVAVCGP
jgi:hypothetical protein